MLLLVMLLKTHLVTHIKTTMTIQKHPFYAGYFTECFTLRIVPCNDKPARHACEERGSGEWVNYFPRVTQVGTGRAHQYSNPKSLFFSPHKLDFRPQVHFRGLLCSSFQALLVTSQPATLWGPQWNKWGHWIGANQNERALLSPLPSAAISGFLPFAQLFCQMFRYYGDWVNN